MNNKGVGGRGVASLGIAHANTGFTTFTRSEERWSRDLRKVRPRIILFMTFVRVAIARSFVSSSCTLILAPLAGNI